jgi:hypothetical protein
MVVVDEEEFRRLPCSIALYRAAQALAVGDVAGLQTFSMPIEGRDEWVAAARRQASARARRSDTRDLRARSGLTREQLIYCGRAEGWLVVQELETVDPTPARDPGYLIASAAGVGGRTRDQPASATRGGRPPDLRDR